MITYCFENSDHDFATAAFMHWKESSDYRWDADWIGDDDSDAWMITVSDV